MLSSLRGRVKSALAPEYDWTREWEAIRKSLRRAISQCGEDGVVRAEINDCPMLLPTFVLEIHQKGLLAKEAFPLSYTIEKPQSDWLVAQLKRGDVAVDVGAAWGVLTTMMSRAVGETGKVYAFEPAPKTFGVLQQVMQLNSIRNVIPENAACGDLANVVEFIQYHKGPNEQTESWVVETSKVRPHGVPISRAHDIYNVPVVVLDDYLADKGTISAIKIDVEGYELKVLEGLKRTLRTSGPVLCIDIHDDPVTMQNLEPAVRRFMADHNYKCEYFHEYYGFFRPQ